jgi:hypothetical protein
MTNKTCFSCIYSFGAIEHLKDHSTLICWPSGNQEREQLAVKLCDEYKREVGADEKDILK